MSSEDRRNHVAMTNLSDLLNPVENHLYPEALRTPVSSPTMTDSASPRKRIKLTKDAAVFTPGPVRGECRFPPDESQDEDLEAYHSKFELKPFGEIADYPRHIPYYSEKKKNFSEGTAREFLEVFQYTFKVPGDDTVYTMLWDYNIGLVRTTPLFKCTGHSKTTPAKVLSRNPGLKEICHSITGGSLVAQGYWMPMDAARAIAATFCYKVRHALTPVFGHDFPDLCLRPGDKGFGDMIIDSAITQRCAEQARQFREGEGYGFSIPALYRRLRNSPTPTTSPVSNRSKTKLERQKKLKPEEPLYTSPYSSPYLTSTESEASYTSTVSTPESSPYNLFTVAKIARQPPRSVPYPERKLPSPSEILAQAAPRRYRPRLPMTPASTRTRSPSPEVSPKTIPRSMLFKGRPAQEYTQATREDMNVGLSLEWLDRNISLERQRAAYTLLSLKFAKPIVDVVDGFRTVRYKPEGDGHFWNLY